MSCFFINNLQTDWKEFLDYELKIYPLNEIDQFLSKQTKIIYPQAKDIFRAFNFFNIEETKIVIFGQDPYHQINQANGLCFSVNNEIKLPPSLRNIFKKLSIDKQINRINGDLTDWAEQDMLLLNTTLTVFDSEPNSHYKLHWDVFIQHVIERLNKNIKPILFVCFGNFAKAFINMINLNKHQVLLWPHPSPLAANRCGFFDNNLFDQIDDFMQVNYHKKIKWI